MTIPLLRRPLVLVHGLLGFDAVRFGGLTLVSYFSDLPEVLAAGGNRVLVPRLPPTAGVGRRAAELVAFLDREAPGVSVHLIAHSMGGLDARYAVSRLGLGSRVRSLTTLGTPHRGTPFADWGIKNIEIVVGPVLDFLGLSREAFHDLSTPRCRAFNEATPDVPGVAYYSVAGRFACDWRTPEWQLPWRVIQEVEGDNDGLVSVASATWGSACDVWEGDHTSLIGRAVPSALVRGVRPDRRAVFAGLLARLAALDAEDFLAIPTRRPS